MKFDTTKLRTKIAEAALEGKTGKEIADSAGVNEMTVSRIMTGKTKMIYASTMNKFAKAFGIDAKELI